MVNLSIVRMPKQQRQLKKGENTTDTIGKASNPAIFRAMPGIVDKSSFSFASVFEGLFCVRLGLDFKGS